MKELGVQFGKFITIGVLNTLIDVGFYFLLTRHSHFFSSHLTMSKAISYVAALTFSYIANSIWTFGSGLTSRNLVIFYLAVGSGIFINVGIHYLVTEVLMANDLLAVLIAAGGTAIWGFSLARFVVFRK